MQEEIEEIYPIPDFTDRFQFQSIDDGMSEVDKKLKRNYMLQSNILYLDSQAKEDKVKSRGAANHFEERICQLDGLVGSASESEPEIEEI